MPDVLMKQAAERAETLKAYFKADVGDRQRARREELLGFLNSSLRKVLMWRFVERRSEESQEMKPR